MFGIRAVTVLSSMMFARVEANWNDWWTYDGISGHGYWGIINPAWHMCTKGEHQSPINVTPRKLVYDPNLKRINIDKSAFTPGVLYNTGQSLLFRTDMDRLGIYPVNITGGPLSYDYQVDDLYFHWGSDPNEEGGAPLIDHFAALTASEDDDDGGNSGSTSSKTASGSGSEHAIDGYFFPGEIQIYAYNSKLFKSSKDAMAHPYGLVALSIMVQESDRYVNRGLRTIANHASKVRYRGQNYPIKNFNLNDLLPSTDAYMTYEGSVTFPGCWETVTWIVFNKPIYVSRLEFDSLRSIMQGTKISPKAPLSNNNRPVRPLNRRPVRTNINFESGRTSNEINKSEFAAGGGSESTRCPDIAKDVSYTSNSWK